MIIGHFVFRRRWLSNFYNCHVEYKGNVYKSVEHAYQAQKAATKRDHDWIARANGAAEARARGRSVKLRPGFDSFKNRLHLKLLWSKFHHNPGLRKRLVATWPHELIHGNSHGDVYWGVCRRTGRGNNILGKQLMFLRDAIRDGTDHRIPQLGVKKQERYARYRQRRRERLEDANLGIVVPPIPPLVEEQKKRYHPSKVKHEERMTELRRKGLYKKQHGIDCPKVQHRPGESYLHSEDDDGPYDVDGVDYCGRCHYALK